MSTEVRSQLKRRIIPKSNNPVNSDGISECFHTCTTEMYISLAPCHIKNPVNGIKIQHLDPLIMTYFPQSQGVVIGYSNINIFNENVSASGADKGVTIAKLASSSPFTFLWITVDLLIWKPQIGDIIEGYCYMQSASHIGLLIHDAFNASIKKYGIPHDWQFIPSQVDEFTDDSSKFKSFGYWIDENETKIEGKLKFTVKSIHTAGRVISIEGTLIKPGTERESQPVFRQRRSSSTSQRPTQEAVASKHKKFDDDDDDDTTPDKMLTVAEEEQNNDKLDNYPKYSNSDSDSIKDSVSDNESD